MPSEPDLLTVKEAALMRSKDDGGMKTSAVQSDLFDDLLEFHQRLAGSQQDLPHEAARLLCENLWQLYD